MKEILQNLVFATRILFELSSFDFEFWLRGFLYQNFSHLGAFSCENFYLQPAGGTSSSLSSFFIVSIARVQQKQPQEQQQGAAGSSRAAEQQTSTICGGWQSAMNLIRRLSQVRLRFPSSTYRHRRAYLHAQSIEHPVDFWRNAAKGIDWIKPCPTVLSTESAAHGRWFPEGTMNTAYNCIDRHILEGRGDNLAIIHDSPVTKSVRKLTFSELKEEVVKLASVFRELGVEKGDRVIVYMPNLPEAAITMLACARIGAIHSVVFGGFADAELAMRITDCQAKIVVAASCGIERGQVLDYKKLLDSALRIVGEKMPELVQHCLILQRPENVVALGERDLDLRGAMDSPSLQIHPECAELQSTDPLYVLYTSGTTGKPKGILRDNGGHAVALRWSMQYVYDMKPGDVFWAAR
jgi:non-ribosomal peptide synthetase component F